jgi:hypothetical protein
VAGRVDLGARIDEHDIPSRGDAEITGGRAHGNGGGHFIARGRPANHEFRARAVAPRGHHVGGREVGTGDQPQAACATADGDPVVQTRGIAVRRRLEAGTEPVIDQQPASRAQGDARLARMWHRLAGRGIEYGDVPVDG